MALSDISLHRSASGRYWSNNGHRTAAALNCSGAIDPKRTCGSSGGAAKLMPHTSLPPITAFRISQISLLHRHGCKLR